MPVLIPQTSARKPRRLIRASLRFVGYTLLAAVLLVTALRWLNPPTSSVILQHNLLKTERQSQWIAFDWVAIDAVSRQMVLAVLAGEDQRFFQHHGLDFVELSIVLDKGGSRPRGASTITQQTAKNLFLWGGRSYTRKAMEAALALYIDLLWGKRRVLEVYLNIVQFGPGIYGVENAAQHFFGKSAAKLNRHEAARLVAVLPNPSARSAANPNNTVLKRQRWILRQMRALGGVAMLEGKLGG